jgi:predicted transcriptional regulator
MQDYSILKDALNKLRYEFKLLEYRAKKRNIKFKLSFDDFLTFKLENHNCCYYCKITENELKFLFSKLSSVISPPSLKWAKRYAITDKFTIDRKCNEKGYTKGNIVKCCFVCNEVKGCIFTTKEMSLIGEEFIKPKYKKLIREIHNFNFTPKPIQQKENEKTKRGLLLKNIKNVISENGKIWRFEVLHISKEIGLSYWTTQAYLDGFVKTGILRKTKQRKQVYYTFN